MRENARVRVSAKADYAVRAMIELAAGGEEAGVMGEAIAAAQDIPLRFVESILAEVRHAGLVEGRHGTDGAYWLTRPADQITLADVIRAVEGPLASVRGESADELAYPGDAKPLQEPSRSRTSSAATSRSRSGAPSVSPTSGRRADAHKRVTPTGDPLVVS